MSKDKYKITVAACCISSLVQAIIVNYAPLLFVNFNKTHGVPLARISLLITISFLIQLMIDISSVYFVNKLGYKICACIAQFFSFAGLAAFGILPFFMNNFYLAIIISAVLYSIGGGMIEVVTSPIIEGCPSDKKDARMSFLHAFYSWGQVGVIAVSTLAFAIFGIDKWQIIAIIMSLMPLVNMFLFIKAPFPSGLNSEGGFGKAAVLFKNKMFVLFVILMICAGASEQAMAQWASAFAETALGITKTMGDLLGPCMFAVFMGIARSLYAGYKGNIKLIHFLTASGALCVVSFLTASLGNNPFAGLIGCAMSGFACGIMWPGIISLSSSKVRNGGSAMFSLLAFGGDIGCTSGPAAVGFISGMAGGELKTGLLASTVFAVVFLAIAIYIELRPEHRNESD